jgi:hypothetical protein
MVNGLAVIVPLLISVHVLMIGVSVTSGLAQSL